MRIPLKKIYRAFPELDSFSDAECEMYVQYVARQRLRTWLLIPLAALVAAFAVLAVIIAAGVYLRPFFSGMSSSINAIVDRFRANRETDVGELVITFCAAFPLLAGPYVAGLVARDWHLRRGIRLRLETAHCPTCRQSLLGLPLLIDERRPSVRCPECGSLLVLAEIGVTPEDLLVRPGSGSGAG